MQGPFAVKSLQEASQTADMDFNPLHVVFYYVCWIHTCFTVRKLAYIFGKVLAGLNLQDGMQTGLSIFVQLNVSSAHWIHQL